MMKEHPHGRRCGYGENQAQEPQEMTSDNQGDHYPERMNAHSLAYYAWGKDVAFERLY